MSRVALKTNNILAKPYRSDCLEKLQWIREYFMRVRVWRHNRRKKCVICDFAASLNVNATRTCIKTHIFIFTVFYVVSFQQLHLSAQRAVLDKKKPVENISCAFCLFSVDASKVRSEVVVVQHFFFKFLQSSSDSI